MKGDFSRHTFDRRKHYRGVLIQQGRVQVDADSNEQQAIEQYHSEAEAKDVIGPCGAPKEQYGGGFKIGLASGGQDLSISKGHFYVDGILCENDRDNMTFKTQDDFFLRNTASNFAGFEMPTAAGRYIVYLHVWQRHVTALDDPLIRETALGGPDTATRLKTVWQVELIAAPSGNTQTCAQLPPNWTPQPASTGTLRARTTQVSSSTNPCVLPPTAGFRRLENQLYRVEVHKGGTREQARFKWSRDNGSVVTTITDTTNIASGKVVVGSLGRDDLLGLASGQWVEIIDDRMELSGQPGNLVQIDGAPSVANEITFKPIPADMPGWQNVDMSKRPKLRRWDQTGVSSGVNGIQNGIEMGTGFISLEDGIEVKFESGTYKTGDYWLIPARTTVSSETGSIEWPFNAPNDPAALAPFGIKHHYCSLGLVDFNNNLFTLPAQSDCRKQFPPLTDITALDVSYNNANCLPALINVKNVQEALDAMCKNRENGCTYVAIPGQDLQALINSIPNSPDPGSNAQICFQAGTYTLPQSVSIKNKGNIKISGCGAATRIVAASAEAALVFEDCQSIIVRDIYAETGNVVPAKTGAKNTGLNGTLTFVDCVSVDVESVSLKCGAAAVKGASCITVRNLATARPARIIHSTLNIGHQQEGILLVNVSRAHVEDNVLRVYDKPLSLTFTEMLKVPEQRAHIRTVFVAGGFLGGSGDPPAGKINVSVSFANMTIWFKTHNSLKTEWQALVNSNPPTSTNAPVALLKHVKQLADRILTDAAFRANKPRFLALFNALAAQDRPVATQGISVAGQGSTARDIRILNNTIENSLQGVHVGLSHRDPTRSAHDSAGDITISGNNIKILLTPDASKRERHGIFVGNCASVLVENNNVRLERLPEAANFQIDGIRLWGRFGHRLLVTQNFVGTFSGFDSSSFDFGINANSLSSGKPFTSLWLVTMNCVQSKQQSIRVVGGVVQTGNIP
jgi:hypothetical protein